MVYGLANGCLYGLIAIGYSMVYSIIGLINFAHGDVFMIGAYFTLTMVGLLSIPTDCSLWAFVGYTILLLTTTSLFCAGVNFFIYKIVYKPLHNAPKLILLVSAIGVSLILQNVGMLWGSIGPANVMGAPKNAAAPKKFPDLAGRGKRVFGTGEPAIASGTIANDQPGCSLLLTGPSGKSEITVPSNASRADVVSLVNSVSKTTGVLATENGSLQTGESGSRQYFILAAKSGSMSGLELGKSQGSDSPIPFSRDHLVILFVTLPIVLALQFLVHKTRIGKAMRACEQDGLASRLMGINPDTVIASTFLVGGFLAGTASVIACYDWGTVRFDMGYTAGLYAFTAAVVGGIGSVSGAMLGGLMLGFTRTVTESYLASQWVNACIFLLLIVFLIFRPSGLLGQKSAEKV